MSLMEKLLADSNFGALKPHSVIKAKVTEIRGDKDVVVDIKGKSEGFIPQSEFPDMAEIQVGMDLEVYLEKLENKDGTPTVSYDRAIQIRKWESIEANCQEGSIVQGRIKSVVKGGLIVSVGVDAFMPSSQIDINPPKNLDVFVGQTFDFKIIKINKEKKNLVVSRRELIEEQRGESRRKLLEEVKPGTIRRGVIKNITDYGAFVEIATGVEGLIHVSEMSWSQHLRSAQDFMSVGDTVEAVVLTLDREERKMSLGIKQLMPDPWTAIEAKYAVGTKHDAKVRNFTNFGVFVELEEGVDGLIHISDLSWQKKIKHPSEFCKVGDEMEVIVLEIDRDNRRISLGHKQLEENPWDVFESIFPIDSVHEGTVLKMGDKGATIAMPYGLEAFCPNKHLVKADGKSLKGDDKAEFKVIEFSKDQRKIVVSHARIHEELTAVAKTAENAQKLTEREESAKAVKKVKDSVEKTTLGDLSVLGNLKNEMEAAEKKSDSAGENNNQA